MKINKLASLISLTAALSSVKADNLSFDWEVVNTNLLPLVDAGGTKGAFRQGSTTLGPFSKDVTLQQVTVGVSMEPTRGWMYLTGFAEVLAFGIISGSPPPVASLQPSQEWGPFITFGGGIFMKNLKIWYQGGGGLNQDIAVELHDLPVLANQSIYLYIQYFSDNVASDVEMGGTLTYK